MEVTLGLSFARSARKFPSKAAVMDDHRRLTYGQLNVLVNRLADGLLALKFERGYP
jgi:non-ribosomal peptide synthetase component E (peptide arylation enzyme)